MHLHAWAKVGCHGSALIENIWAIAAAYIDGVEGREQKGLRENAHVGKALQEGGFA